MNRFDSPCISSFSGRYFFLSNYFPHSFVYKGIKYLSSEAAFHAQKDESRAKEFEFLTPNRAKRLGRLVKLRPDWEDVKKSIMKDILIEKFSDKKLRQKLIETYPYTLIEGNDWGDKYWGVDFKTQEGQNNLGKILMEIRKEIIDGVLKYAEPYIDTDIAQQLAQEVFKNA